MEHNNIAFNVTNHYSDIYQNFCFIGGFFEQNNLSPTVNKINDINNGYITSILTKHGYTGKLGETLLLHQIPNTIQEKILLIGCGKKDSFNKKTYQKIIYQSIKTLKNTHTKQIFSCLTELNVHECNNYWKIRYAIEIIQNILYNFTQFKSHTPEKYERLENIIFYINTNHKELQHTQKAITDGTIISRNINIAKDLGNMPPNFCNTQYLIQKSRELEKIYDHTTTQIIEEKEMKTLGMNAYLSVGQASNQSSLMSIIKYIGNPIKEEKPLILVGKGVTFDSGGLSIKPSERMDEMKYDMCGAAAVYAILRTVIQLNLPINIIGVLATCENVIASSALRPGDILKTLSGQTIEVKNTDAEGRLILCDALTYVLRFNPKIIIDIATLTGACAIALGEHYTGLMSNHDPLAHELIKAGQETNDQVWRLPLHENFHKQLHSNIADIKNIGGKLGGAITAACFLQKFIGTHQWAHLDIAGTAWTSNEEKNSATGRPVAMLTQFLINYATNTKK